MKRAVVAALFAFSAGAASVPAWAAGTNEISPGDSPATGMTGTGSNAADQRVTPVTPASPAYGASTGSSTVVVPAAPPTVVAPATPGTAVVVPPNTDATVIVPNDSGRAARNPNAIPDPRVDRDAAARNNHGAVGGESGGKSSDSPGQ